MLQIGFMILMATLLVQITWMIFFCPAEKGPPPNWSLYPIPPALALIMAGIFFGH